MKIVTAKSTDGLTFRGLLSEPESNPKGIIIHTHGMCGSPLWNEYYVNMHSEYPKNGWAFLAGQNRGSESITQFINKDNDIVNIGDTFEIFEECIYDIQGWINYAKSLGYKKIWLQAHSLGPSKVAYYVNQVKPKDIEGLIFISPSDMIGLVNDPTGSKDHERLLPEALELIKQNKPRQILSNFLWGNMMLSAQSYISFFGKNAKDAIFNFGKPELGWEVVNSITLPVLAFTGTKDDGIVPVMDPYKAMKLLEEQLKNSLRKKTIVLEGAEHSFDGFGDMIVKEVLDFIK